MAFGKWKQILADTALQRSSHVVSVINQRAYVFGGELVPREPRDNTLFEVGLQGEAGVNGKLKITSLDSSSAPSPRVGSASATIVDRLYLFSGRGGQAMKPIEESGSIYEYDATSSAWRRISPTNSSSSYPPARSYHCMTSDGNSTLFLHAGCPESGRLADLWSFDVKNEQWDKLPDAPPPQRGGTSITYIDGKLYRMNGFDGKREQGGSLDIFDVGSGTWSTEKFKADSNDGPEARSVSVLLPVIIGNKSKLLTLFGERDPSSLGHAGAGKMLGDWWIYDIVDRTWEKGANKSAEVPAARGWFDADVLDGERVVVVGGLNENNDRLDDVWLLDLSK